MLYEFIRAWHVVFASVGCVCNLLLCYVALRKTPRATKSYATLIINFAVTDFLECLQIYCYKRGKFRNVYICSVFEFRFLVTPFNVTLIYVYHGLCQYLSPLTCNIALSVFYHCMPHTAWSLLLSFTYRYYILHHPSLTRRTLGVIIFIVYIPSFLQANIYWPTIVGRDEILPYADKFYPQYNLSLETAVLGGIPTINEFASIFVIIHICFPIFPIYISIFILRGKIVKDLMEKATMLSHDQRATHKQILKCLTIQSLIPSLFIVCVSSYMSAQLGILTHPILEYSIFACVIPMPLLSSLTYLVYIRPYRVFCSRLLKHGTVTGEYVRRESFLTNTGKYTVSTVH